MFSIDLGFVHLSGKPDSPPLGFLVAAISDFLGFHLDLDQRIETELGGEKGQPEDGLVPVRAGLYLNPDFRAFDDDAFSRGAEENKDVLRPFQDLAIRLERGCDFFVVAESTETDIGENLGNLRQEGKAQGVEVLHAGFAKRAFADLAMGYGLGSLARDTWSFLHPFQYHNLPIIAGLTVIRPSEKLISLWKR
jgi:hypothetical protein